MSRVGIRQVAAHAGVAVGTVSHYLNHPDKVSDERAERIRASIDELGFVPNNAGRQLRLGHGSAIAYIVPSVNNPYFTEIAESVERRSAERGLAMFVANSHRDPERESAYLDFFEQHQVRGILVASHHPIEDRLAEIRRRGTPSVLVAQQARSPEQPSISLDDVEGGRLAAQHLLDQGCRRIAFVGGPMTVSQVAARLTGAGEAVRATPGAVLEVIDQPRRSLAGGHDVGLALVERSADQRPDGVFAANDRLALGLIQALVRGGVSVPDDIALVGYDDIPFSQISIVPLTSVRGPLDDFGSAVVDLLLNEIEGRTDHDRHPVFTPELVIRESSMRRGEA